MSATDGVVSFLEQVITAAERVMGDTKTPLRTSKWLVQVWESVGQGEGKRGKKKKLKEKILHVFSIKIVVPYEAATQKAKNGA